MLSDQVRRQPRLRDFPAQLVYHAHDALMIRAGRLPEPETLIALLVLGQLVLWTLAPAISHISPPLDVIESYMWGREWVVATYKHPSMPGWVLEASYLLTGAYGWPAYIVSQLFIVASFIFVFLLGRDLMGAERAAAGTLLLTGIAYYAWWTPELKHNIAETPFWAGLPWLLWRAVERRSVKWWVLAGAFAGVGMYARLTVGLLMVTALVWMLVDRRARQALATPGPWIGLAVFAVLCIPLARWLIANDFVSLAYASRRSAQSQNAARFILQTLLNLSGVGVMLALAGLLTPPWRGRATGEPSGASRTPAEQRALTLLLIFTCVPVTIAIAGAVITGGGLKTGWGNSIFGFVGLLAILLTSHRFTQRSLKTIAVAAAACLIVVPIGYALVIGFGPRFNGAPARVHWPQAEMAERMSAIWTRETDRPLRIVTGDSWVAGLVGLTAKERPSLLDYGGLKLSPWITPARIDAEGMLVVWDARSQGPPEALQAELASHVIKEEKFAWPRFAGRPPLVIRYAVIPPKQPPR
jgi:4-amino-4-deoxy-L-arabinose transferase-like glycosyltransferase